MLQGGGSDDQVRLGKGMSDFAALFNQEAPLEHHLLGNFQDTLLKQGPNSVQQPIVQLGTTNRIADHLDTVAEFGEGDRADKQVVEPLARDESAHSGTGARLAQLRNDIGIKQPAAHNLTVRTGIAERPGSIPIWRCGDDRNASMSNSPVRAPCRRLNSPASTTTTASRPCKVTVCGPSLWAIRTSSLNRAFAS